MALSVQPPVSTIPLAQPEYTPEKLTFPALVSEKLDGVPIRIDIIKYAYSAESTEVMSILSRSGESMMSAKPIAARLAKVVEQRCEPGMYTIIGECTHPDHSNFKDISGIVRRHLECPELVFNIFDFYSQVRHWHPVFIERIADANSLFSDTYRTIRVIPQYYAGNAETVDEWVAYIKHYNTKAEGCIARSAAAPFKPGTRHWDYQKIVEDPTIDLNIVDLQEGKGKNANAVGRLIASYMGTEIGVSPGKMSYKDRNLLWQEYKLTGWLPHMACIKYKRDPSYSALRQPTFQHWRFDKVEPDA